MDNSSNTVVNSFALSGTRKDGARLSRALSAFAWIGFAIYTAFSLAWLSIGLLPPLAAALPSLRRALADLAGGFPLFKTLVQQVIHISLYGFVDPDSILVQVTGFDATFQYLFSIVN